MIKSIIAIAIIIFIFACSGGGNNGSNSNTRPPVSSALDLRLGQISSSSSPVAVSATLQNGESITIYSDSETNDLESIYIAPTGDTLQVKHDQAGKPFFAQYGSTSAAYTNYTKENTVDITIQSPDTNRRARSTSINHHLIEADVLEFLNSEQLLQIILDANRDSDSGIRALLASAYAALRVVACSSSEFAPAEFSTELCSSILLEKIRKILEQSNYGAITVNLTNTFPECENPQTYEEESACALIIWNDLLEATKKGVVGDYPNNNSSGSNSGSNSNTGSNSGSATTSGDTGSIPPTPTFTSTPTSTPTFTPTPTDTPISGGGLGFFGSWTGGGNGVGPCGGSSYTVSFDVVSTGDDTCLSIVTPCIVQNGTLIGINGFPITNSILGGRVFYDSFNKWYTLALEIPAGAQQFFSSGPILLNMGTGKYQVVGGFLTTPNGCGGPISNYTQN